MDSLFYEWTVEHLDKDGDIIDSDFEITTKCGEVFLVTPHKSKQWRCLGVSYETINHIKLDIVSDVIDYPEGSDPDEEDSEDEEPDEVVDVSDLWDTVCPACALLAILSDLQFTGLKPMMRDMLDKYGLLLEDGTPNIEYARKQVELYRVKYENKQE